MRNVYNLKMGMFVGENTTQRQYSANFYGKTNRGGNGYITCYPNPASKSINFKYLLPNGAEQGIIKIYSDYGQLVQSFSINKSEGLEVVNLSKQSDGIYFYSLWVENTIVDKGKFIINK